jgi:hypothetical protein
MATNAVKTCCNSCGAELKAGEGRLEFVPDAHDNDDFDRVGTDRENAHWEAFCVAEDACKSRVSEIAARQEAERAEAKRVRVETAAKEAAERKVKQEAWELLTAGLVRTESQPAGRQLTGEFVDSGLKATCEKVTLPGGLVGWRVDWIGDSDGCYYLVPPSVRDAAEAEDARLHRVYQWWRPGNYGPDSYPGPGIPESELTNEERAEVAKRWAEKRARIEADWEWSAQLAIKPGYSQRLKGCQAWEKLAAVGADLEVVIDPEALRAFCRSYAYDEDENEDKEDAEEAKLVVTLRATLPAAARNKNGSIKAAVKRRLPFDHETQTHNNFIEVVVEYV